MLKQSRRCGPPPCQSAPYHSSCQRPCHRPCHCPCQCHSPCDVSTHWPCTAAQPIVFVCTPVSLSFFTPVNSHRMMRLCSDDNGGRSLGRTQRGSSSLAVPVTAVDHSKGHSEAVPHSAVPHSAVPATAAGHSEGHIAGRRDDRHGHPRPADRRGACVSPEKRLETLLAPCVRVCVSLSCSCLHLCGLPVCLSFSLCVDLAVCVVLSYTSLPASYSPIVLWSVCLCLFPCVFMCFSRCICLPLCICPSLYLSFSLPLILPLST